MSRYEHENCERLIEELQDEVKALRVACKLALKLPRPWIDGGVSWQEWDDAMSAIEAVVQETGNE